MMKTMTSRDDRATITAMMGVSSVSSSPPPGTVALPVADVASTVGFVSVLVAVSGD